MHCCKPDGRFYYALNLVYLVKVDCFVPNILLHTCTDKKMVKEALN
jgi:hypothetical protein